MHTVYRHPGSEEVREIEIRISYLASCPLPQRPSLVFFPALCSWNVLELSMAPSLAWAKLPLWFLPNLLLSLAGAFKTLGDFLLKHRLPCFPRSESLMVSKQMSSVHFEWKPSLF